MAELMRRVRMQTVLSALLTLLMGILLIAMPGIAIETLFLILGWMLVITGASSIVISWLVRGRPVAQGELVLGLLQVASGLVLVLRPNLLVSLFGIILGLVLIMHGGRDIQNAREARALGYSGRFPLIVGIITLVMGAMILLNPFSTAKLLMRTAGVFLVLDAIGDLLMVQGMRH